MSSSHLCSSEIAPPLFILLQAGRLESCVCECLLAFKSYTSFKRTHVLALLYLKRRWESMPPLWRRGGGGLQVILREHSIHETFKHVFLSSVFLWDRPPTFYPFASGETRKLCVWMPFGIQIVYFLQTNTRAGTALSETKMRKYAPSSKSTVWCCGGEVEA